MSALLASLGFLVLAQAPTAVPVRPVPPPGLSWEDADEIATTVRRIERRLSSGRPASRETIVVTQRQLNSYVGLSLAPSLPPGVSGLEFGLDQGRLGVRAMLDLDRLSLPRDGAASLLSLLRGTVPLEIRGRLPSGKGKGRIEVEEAFVAGVSLPASLLAQIVQMSTRSAKNPGGFDLSAPFDLPWTISRIRFEPGRALVEFQP